MSWRDTSVIFNTVVLGAAIVLASCGPKTAEATSGHRSDAAVPVRVAAAIQRDVPIDVQVIGSVEAYSTITVKALVSGQLTSAGFHEGDFVKKGDVLFSIDPRPYDAALKQAEAMLLRDKAQLSQAQANLARDEAQAKYAHAEAARYDALFKEGIMSHEQTDQVRANADALLQAAKADRAAIESAHADIAAANAALEQAKVQLSYCTIRSPIDGRTGNLTVKAGNVVTANTTELMTINEIHPVYVTFSVPEMHLQAIKRYMAESKLQVTAFPQDGGAQSETGFLTFVDNTVDASTGTIKLKGTFDNPHNKLWPGQFVRVSLRLTTQPNAITVPNAAVQTGQDGTFVFVVKPDRTVDVRPVTVGPRVAEDLVIDSGLQPGETVVTEGQLRLAPGARVAFPGESLRPAHHKGAARKPA